MDRLRQALGDSGLTYMGQSYGTLLGPHLRRAVPDPHAGHGARRRHRPGADVRPDHPRAGRGLRGGARPRSSPGAPARPPARGARAGTRRRRCWRCRRRAATAPVPAGGGQRGRAGRALRRAARRALRADGLAAARCGAWPPTRPATARRWSPCPTTTTRSGSTQRRRRRHGHRLPRPPASRDLGVLRLPGRARSRRRHRSSGRCSPGARRAAPCGRRHRRGRSGRWPPRVRRRSWSWAPPTTRPRPTPGRSSVAQELSHGVLLTHDGDDHVAYFYSACVRADVQTYLVSGRRRRRHRVQFVASAPVLSCW